MGSLFQQSTVPPALFCRSLLSSCGPALPPLALSTHSLPAAPVADPPAASARFSASFCPSLPLSPHPPPPAGISLKTQELYLLVFLTRYLDLFTNFYSLYNTLMKVVYLAASGWIVYMLRFQVREREREEARRQLCPGPAPPPSLRLTLPPPLLPSSFSGALVHHL
jgi:hypothetical protein